MAKDKKKNNSNKKNNNNGKKQNNKKVVTEEKEVKKNVVESIPEKEEKKKVENKTENEKVNTNEEKDKAAKDFNRRFWIDVVLLLLVFVVIGIIFYQLISRSITKDDIESEKVNIIEYDINNSVLDMSVEEYIDTLKGYGVNTSLFGNVEKKDINEGGKKEGLYYYQATLGEENYIGLVTKKENKEIVSIDFISKKDNLNYKEDFKKIIEYTLDSSGVEKNSIDTVVEKFDNREKLDKTYDGIKVFMEESSNNYYITKIIYNKRLSTKLKSIYSEEVNALIGKVD